MKSALGWSARGSYRAGPVSLAVFLMALGIAEPAGAQTTALFLDSQAGDHIGGGLQRTFTGANAAFQVLYDTDGSVSASVDGSSSWWDLDFAAHSAPLQVREYENATRWPFTPFVGMNVFGEGRSCNTLTGRYWIREIVYGVNGAVQRLAVDFEQHCSDEAPALFGALRYNSTISSLIPFDGLYPIYNLSIAPPTGGVVTGPGINCDATGLGCSASLAGATTVTLTATPDPGYLFAGWIGHCHGGRTITMFVNTGERCTALFDPIGATGPATLLFWNSQQGDYIGQGRREVYNHANSRWTVEGAQSGALLLAVESVDDTSDSFWWLGFFAPIGSAVTTGTYTNVTRFPTATSAGMDISGNFRGCGVISGSFTIHELAVAGNVVTRLALDFEQHCEGVMIPARPLRGSIRYNSEVPPRPTLAVTTTGSGARVVLSQPGTECVERCMETYGTGAEVRLIPRPAPGWALASWSGDADCADGVVTVNAPAACHATFLPATIAADSVAPASGSGAAQVFALQYSSSGATSVTTPWVWFNATTASSAADSCLLHYDRATGTLFLLNDAATVWQPAPLGSAATLQNSQCAVDLGGSSVGIAGTTLTLNLSMRFKPAYAGAKNIYMYAGGAGGAASGWSDRGDWTVPAAPVPGVTAVGVTPASGSGATQTFAFEYSHNLGASELATTWVWINTALASSAAGSCLVHYDQPAGLLRLLSDDGTTWLAASLGSGTLQNSQCAIALGGSSAVPSGNTLTLTLAMTFRPAFSGAKNMYMYAAGVSGAATGWQLRGTWTIPGGSVTADAVTPNSGSGMTGTFALQYSNAAGASGLSTVWVWFNATFATSAAGSCLIYYEPSTHTVRLINDGGTDWLAAPLGGGGTLQNSQCAVALGSSTAAPAGTTLTLSLAMTFEPAFAGAKSIFMYAASAAGATSGWQTRGAWTVQGVTVTADSVTPASGTGSTQTFALQYTDSLGAADLSTVWVWFNATFASSAAGSCLIYYEPQTDTVRLINDGGTNWLAAPLGGGGTLQNSQCSIALASASAVPSGNTMTFTLPVTFTSGTFSGAKSIFMYAASAGGATSGWQTRGSWTVP